MAEEWCDLCELPRATCVHGMAAPPPPPAEVKRPAPRKTATRSTAPSRARKETGPRRPDTRVSVRRTTRAQTPSAAYRPLIVAVLQEHGGECEAETLLEVIHERMADSLLEGDHEAVPGGEARWRFAARQERAAMTKDGLLAPPRRPGLWELA